ncbi:hypothetical protein [Heliorestis convoluta]|uniref:Uncharacterized protein n=1 Tax=Heliorestis convoluta TaxID=356322 RepID=A0A5Q2N0S5_9FIRM|nr:hypothetical protein [Heliorestis convoluta]QGG47399.1 hypothetical protein FTV88_1252 [Heliorestis convoluta]
MKNISFFDWKINLEENLSAVVDNTTKKLVIMDGSIELNAVIWIDSSNLIQIKPTWDCVITIDDKNKAISIRHADYLRNN